MLFLQFVIVTVVLHLICIQFIECIRHLTKHIPDESWYDVNETRKTILIKLEGGLEIHALTGINGIKHLTPDYANSYTYRCLYYIILYHITALSFCLFLSFLCFRHQYDDTIPIASVTIIVRFIIVMQLPLLLIHIYV
jgi:hypothetical protein